MAAKRKEKKAASPAPKVSARLGESEMARSLKDLKGWAIDGDGMLRRAFKFDDFPRAFGFMASVATIAQAMDHHPDWSNVYNRVEVRLSTHDAGGLTEKDFELARRISTLV